LSLSLIALVSYCLFYRNLLFSYSATQPHWWNKLSQSVTAMTAIKQTTSPKPTTAHIGLCVNGETYTKFERKNGIFEH